MTLVAAPDGAPGAKLPLGQTIGLAYSSYLSGFIDALRISWLWLVVAGLFASYASWLQWSWAAPLFRAVVAGQRGAPRPPAIPSQPLEVFLFTNGSSLLLLFAGVSIAVAWHRRLILGEHPGFSGSNLATGTLWRYIGVGLAMVLITVLPAILVLAPLFYFLAPAAGLKPGAGFFVMFLAAFAIYVTVAACLLRLCVLLPARAVGDTSLTFKQAWARTRGNTWRMFWGIMACTVPPLIFAQIALAVLGGFPNPATMLAGDEGFAERMTAASAVFTVYYLLNVPIGIGFLSHAYRHFFQPA